MARRRLGLLGPAIVIAGIAIAAVGVWYMVVSKPRVGEVIDTFVVDANTQIVVRAERGGPRSFVEFIVGGELRWQAMIPPYAGRPGQPGIAWSDVAVAMRVVRGNKAEVFALSRANGSKLGGIHLGLDHAAKLANPQTGPITIDDHKRSYEIVAGDGWNQLVAIDLRLGTALWKQELGPTPVTAGRVEGGVLVIEQAARRRWFNVFTGKEDQSMDRHGKPWEAPSGPDWSHGLNQEGSNKSP
jgi:outer membrane protein assembly factor BamB